MGQYYVKPFTLTLELNFCFHRTHSQCQNDVYHIMRKQLPYLSFKRSFRKLVAFNCRTDFGNGIIIVQ